MSVAKNQHICEWEDFKRTCKIVSSYVIGGTSIACLRGGLCEEPTHFVCEYLVRTCEIVSSYVIGCTFPLLV